MKINLSEQNWTVTGYTPNAWGLKSSMELDIDMVPEFHGVDASVPGSLQKALRTGGLLPDWNTGLNSLSCEWVEHRDWIYSTTFDGSEFSSDRTVALHALGIDGFGFILLNDQKIGEFKNGFIPHRFELNSALKDGENRLEVVFTECPRFYGTPNFSTQLNEWKARFNYTWDWMPRNVQLGFWDDLWIEEEPEFPLGDIRVETDVENGQGLLFLQTDVSLGDHVLNVLVKDSEGKVLEANVSGEELNQGHEWNSLPVKLWCPAGEGDQPLYSLTLKRCDPAGQIMDERICEVGFRQIRWLPCEGAPENADPWICEVNGTPVFLAGVNWTPIRAHYADVTEQQYRERIQAYRDLGMNTLRVWGGAFLEKECFYRICDELGMLVWQEFPLSSSGPDNTPPTEPSAIEDMEVIARSYIRRRRHHACLFIWCGGNELQHDGQYNPGVGVPYGLDDHPMLKRIGEISAQEDPRTLYLPCSSSGPKFMAAEEDFGKGIHWDVHGPWRLPEEDWKDGQRYWDGDDSLFRSETGAPGASSVDLLEEFRGECDLLPVSLENPLWLRASWWVDSDAFKNEKGRDPSSIEEYVDWSQDRQARTLYMAVSACRKRFPAMGGILLWMGHDSFPCPANTSILDFHGRPKPAAHAVAAALRGEPCPE